MLTGNVESLAMDPASNCVLTIIEDVPGDAQGSMPVLLSPLHTTQVLNWDLDNAKTHTECVAMKCLAACKTLPWPGRSPDLSTIQHAWDMMGRRLHIQGNVNHLALQLEQIWQEIPQQTIRVLYHSMPRRVAALHAAAGGSTSY
ncbi:transposable element Tc1 transposase [Trichonephila clavipes]|uniref:Transposable element Tc1 transposase n=1 Tax=Trichonephila clavipes TaxID=2585209 RepID=A0A8X6R7V4_TRICX|nr:transposable element Tc1 transposase [Trichonephila clavipes]